MKNQIITIGIAILVATGLGSCKKDTTTPVYNQSASSGNTMENGKWVVSSFELNGVEHSDIFVPYIFTFRGSEVLATSGAGRVTVGKWSMGTVNNEQQVTLDFGTDETLGLLNNTAWKVTGQTATSLMLSGTRGDDGKETLSFKKL